MRAFIPNIVACAGLCALLLSAPVSRADDHIDPPFNLQWGESKDHLERLLKGAKATVSDRHDVNGCEAWSVEGLVQLNLKRTVFYFRGDQLVGVELQYQSPDWDTVHYDTFMSEVRKHIETKYGAGQLVAKSKIPEGHVMQTIVGYKWNMNNTSIELIYYSAEDTSQIYRTVSLHYKTS